MHKRFQLKRELPTTRGKGFENFFASRRAPLYATLLGDINVVYVENESVDWDHYAVLLSTASMDLQSPSFIPIDVIYNDGNDGMEKITMLKYSFTGTCWPGT